MSAATGQLFILLQKVLPKHLLTAFVFWLARIKTVGVKNFLIRNFVKLYDVNVEEIDGPVPDGFESFNAFFTRELSEGARPIDATVGSIISPVDGSVSAAGPIEDEQIFQAKGFRYSLSDLLATDLQDAEQFRNGRFATIYLAPYNYHRIHAPLGGSLRVARYVPGDLYSVSATTVERIPGLFARNERLICHVDSPDTPYILIFVGALNVGSISTPWTGEIRPRKNGMVEDCDIVAAGMPKELSKGDLFGWFNMGSTVILLMPGQTCSWSDTLTAGATVKMGQTIGQTIGLTGRTADA